MGRREQKKSGCLQAGGDQPEAQYPEIKRLEEGWQPKESLVHFHNEFKVSL